LVGLSPLFDNQTTGVQRESNDRKGGELDLSLLANGQIKLHLKDDSVYCRLDDTIFGEKYSKDFRLVF
jgi:hypothetical protein